MVQNSSVISSQQLAKTLGLSEQECDRYLKHTQIKTPTAGKFWKIALIATPFWQRVSREIFGAYVETLLNRSDSMLNKAQLRQKTVYPNGAID